MKDLYTIYYFDWCGYSKKALELAKKKALNTDLYNIDNYGGKDNVLKVLKKQSFLTASNRHNTAPIIFKNGVFLGGYTEFEKHLK